MAMMVAVKLPKAEALPVMTPELFILSPEGNPVADQLVGLRSAGIWIFAGVPVEIIKLSAAGADHIDI